MRMLSDSISTSLTIAVLALISTAIGCRGDRKQVDPIAARATSPKPGAATVGDPDPCPGVAAIDVSYMLDRDLTQGLYLGARWVSPPIYRLVRPKNATDARVEVRAVLRDRAGRSIAGDPTWKPAHPDVVSVSPRRGPTVMLGVAGPGATTVEVTCGKVTRVLAVDAAHVGDALRVAISRR